MGTNYYLETGKTEIKHCDCGFDHEIPEVLHIGKNSFGWLFTLQIIPERGINELDDWIPLMKKGKIKDEYGEYLSYKEMIDLITHKEKAPTKSKNKEICAYMNSKNLGYKTFMDEDSGLLRVSETPKGKDGTYCLESGEFC